MPIIEVEHLHKRYRDTVAVEDVSFTVERGEIFGIIGPNGAGKTTTVETVEGLRTPDRGTVRVLGLDPWRDRAELRQRVGVQLQQSDLYDKVRVGEALELFASFYRDPADPGRLLDELGLAGKRDTMLQQALRRPAPAPVDRPGPGRQPRGRHPGRAQHRPRPARPARHLAADRADQGQRGHGRAGQPLHGGDRPPQRPGGGARRRPGGGHRHPRAAHRPGGRRAATPTRSPSTTPSSP